MPNNFVAIFGNTTPGEEYTRTRLRHVTCLDRSKGMLAAAKKETLQAKFHHPFFKKPTDEVQRATDGMVKMQKDL